MKRSCTKTWKILQIFCPRLSGDFSFSFYLFKNAIKFQKLPVLFFKKNNLFINTVLMLSKQPLVPNLYFTLKNKIVLFKIYHIYLFVATKLPWISIWRERASFEILKSSENVKSRSLDWVRNENLFPLGQKIIDKFIKLSKIGFLWLGDLFIHQSHVWWLFIENIGFWVAGWVLSINPRHFRDFLEIP